jgi:hypothetical protein
MLVFVVNLGAAPSCCFAMLCHSSTLRTSGRNRDDWTLVGVQVGRVLGDSGEIVVVCTIGGGEPRGVGDTLGESVSSRWGHEGGTLGI